MRILHLHGSFLRGGKEGRTVRLMNAWGSRASHTVLIANDGADGAREMIDPEILADFPADAPSLAGKPEPFRYLRIARFMRDFDLILSYNWGSMDGVMAHRLLSPVMRLPPLIHHEDGFNADEADGLNPLRNGFRRIALARAHMLVVPSRKLEGIALSAWRRPTAKVRQIANGIAISRFSVPPAPDAMPGFVRDPAKLVVGTVAGLRPVKNLRRLVRALAPHRDRLQLLIVGEGEDRAAIAAEASALGVDLHMPGHLSDPASFVGLFDIFALSSDSEQFPISLVEAMAAGLPVAATDVGDVAAMVAMENRALIVPADADGTALGQALGRLASDSVLRAKLGAANLAVARSHYDERAMIDSYAALYDEAMARGAQLR